MWKKLSPHHPLKWIFTLILFFSLYPGASVFASNNCFCWYYGDAAHTAGVNYCVSGYSGSEYIGSETFCETNCIAMQDATLKDYKTYQYTTEETGRAAAQAICDRNPKSAITGSTSTTINASTMPEYEFVAPELAVTLDPNFKFSPILSEGGIIKITYLSEYIQMIYNFLLGAMSIVVIIMVMVRGVQYLTAGSSGRTKEATKGISGVVWGFALLLCSYTLLKLVNPELMMFRALDLESVDAIKLAVSLEGNGGSGSSNSSLASMADPYQTIYQTALKEGTCKMTNSQKFYSPTGNGPKTGNHHWYDQGKNGEWEKINALDWASSFGSAIRAPFKGTVTYQQNTGMSSCGNTIMLKGNNASVTFCHAKDFLDDAGVENAGKEVGVGTTIGHSGGSCCDDYASPGGSYVTQCTNTATACTDPTKQNASCGCQPPEQAGNTTGHHVHVTWNGDGNFLPCLVDGTP